MSISGISSGSAPSATETAQAVSSARRAEGIFLGHTVKASDSPASLLADAAEELGFAIDRTKDYEISRRKEKDGADAAQRRLLEAYRAQMERMNGPQSTSSLIESLKKLSDRQQMARALHQAFPDPTDAWAGLEAALEAFDADPGISEHAKTELRALRDDHLAEHGVAVRLGLHGALAASDRPELGSIESSRDFYRDTVGEFSSVSEVFSEIQKHYGSRFDDAMDFLFAAISSDISSDTPSMERTHLESIHAKLGLVRLTQSAYRICEDVLVRWSDVHGVTGAALSAASLLGDLLSAQERHWTAAGRIDSIVKAARAPDIEREVLFIQDLLSGVRKFPIQLFNDDASRSKTLDALQSALDAAVEREDEYLASLDDA